MVCMEDRYEPFAKTFAELTLDELYGILRVRAEVFVVEQRCFYLDPDGIDRDSIHVWLRDGSGALAAYARAFPEPGAHGVWHIGRVFADRRRSTRLVCRDIHFNAEETVAGGHGMPFVTKFGLALDGVDAPRQRTRHR